MRIVVSEDIILTSLVFDDIEERYKVIDSNREFLRKWLGWLDYYSSSKDVYNFTKTCNEKEKNNEEYVLGIYFKGNFAGCISIQKIDSSNKKCEIGYWLAEEYNGNGIVTKSCAKLINYIYDNMDFNRISILVATENYSSQSIPKRLGFVEEGILIENELLYGVFIDNYSYSMTKVCWEKLRIKKGE